MELTDSPENLMRSTVNKQGWVLPYLDPYCTEFVERTKSMTGPIADLGCGYGFTAKKLLEAGATVIANDLSEPQLEELRVSVPPNLASRLSIVPGDVSNLTFEDESLGGILAARWMHFLSSEDVRGALRKFFRWLRPGGILCITCNTLVHIATPEGYAEYLDRKQQGEEWPGKLSNATVRPYLAKNMPPYFYGFDVETLTREVTLAGFTVEDCGLYGTVGITKAWLDDNCVGIMAIKDEISPELS